MTTAHEVAVRAVAAALCPEQPPCNQCGDRAWVVLAALNTPEVRAALVAAVEAGDETCHAGSPRGISDVNCYSPVPAAVDAVLDALAGAERESL